MERLLVGAAKADITVYERGMPMMGWGLSTNLARGVHTPLSVRAFVFVDPNTQRRVAFVCCELLMIPDSLRLGVLEYLDVHAPEAGIDAEGLLLTSTHTHSGPGGYPHDLFFNLPNPGHSPRVLRGLVQRIGAAIAEAAERIAPATLRLATTRIPESEGVAFNRRVDAYNLNDDVTPVGHDGRCAATDRTMTVLRIDGDDGRTIGVIDWFAIHGTSVHSDQHLLHPDNKGVAARVAEHELAEAGNDAVVAFAQAAAGDVTPNDRPHKRRGFVVGGGVDDFVSATITGRAQAKHAALGYSAARDAEPPVLDAVLVHIDFRGFVAAPRFARGREDAHTGAARMGMTFVEGTLEGPGPLLQAQGVTRVAHKVAALRRWTKRKARGDSFVDIHGTKFPFLDIGTGGTAKAFGLAGAAKPPIPGVIDPVVQAMHDFSAVDGVAVRPWAPNVLALQVLVLGRLAVVGLPFEPTTVAGRRLQAQALAALRERGVEHVVVCGYANGYAHYLTTWEEYQLQRYEGASTLYGQWSLAAVQTRLEDAYARLRTPIADRDRDVGPAIRPARASEVYAQLWEGAEVSAAPLASGA